MRSPFDLTLNDVVDGALPGDARVLYRKMFRVREWNERGPVVGKRAGPSLYDRFDFKLPKIVGRTTSADGSTKLLLELSDGARIETVHMPRAVKNPRVTLCLSSQVGCAMGCTFCHTGTMGLVRNLSAAEIVGQLLVAIKELGPADTGRITIVFMGMGEPLHNTAAVLRAIEVMSEPAGLHISPQRITVSTSGLIPGIEELAAAKVRPCLALSVNATTDESRARTMPVTRTHGLAQLRETLARYPLRSHEKITLEYVLLAGENDSDEDAKRLAEFAKPFRHNVNVIPYNEFEGTSYRVPTEAALERFSRILLENGCLVTVRRSRGRDVAAACGQLVQLSQARPRRR